MNKDRRKDIDKAIGLLQECREKFEEAKSLVTSAAEGEREYHDNMADNLKSSERGEKADEAAGNLEEVQNELDGLDLDDLVGKLEEARD